MHLLLPLSITYFLYTTHLTKRGSINAWKVIYLAGMPGELVHLLLQGQGNI